MIQNWDDDDKNNNHFDDINDSFLISFSGDHMDFGNNNDNHTRYYDVKYDDDDCVIVDRNDDDNPIPRHSLPPEITTYTIILSCISSNI